MKKIISIFLVCLLAVGIGAWIVQNKHSAQSDPTAETQTQNEQEKAGTAQNDQASTQNTSNEQNENQNNQNTRKNVTLKIPFMQTDDWDVYHFTEYNGKSETDVTVSVSADDKIDGASISKASGLKYAEVVGIVLYKDGQTAFDNMKLNQNTQDITYTQKETGQITCDGTTRNCTLIKGKGPTDNGEIWYIYDYILDYGTYAVHVTFYSYNQYDTMPAEHEELLSSITINM